MVNVITLNKTNVFLMAIEIINANIRHIFCAMSRK